jgi:hypothetical protein
MKFRYYIKKNGTVNATVSFRLSEETMAKVKARLLAVRSVTHMLTTLVKKASNGPITAYKPVKSCIVDWSPENPLEFKNGSFIAAQGGGWYTAFGNGEDSNNCFFSLNAVLGALQYLSAEANKPKTTYKSCKYEVLQQGRRVFIPAEPDKIVPRGVQYTPPSQEKLVALERRFAHA